MLVWRSVGYFYFLEDCVFTRFWFSQVYCILVGPSVVYDFFVRTLKCFWARISPSVSSCANLKYRSRDHCLHATADSSEHLRMDRHVGENRSLFPFNGRPGSLQLSERTWLQPAGAMYVVPHAGCVCYLKMFPKLQRC